MLINPSGEPLLAQLPYLSTSIACVVLDGMVRDRAFLPERLFRV